MLNKIILLQINFSEDHSEKILPLGILSVGSALKRSGYDVELYNINEKDIDVTIVEIIDKDPLFIGLSVMTGIQTRHSAEFSIRIKSKKNIPIVWGGIHPSLLPEQCLSENYIDYVIISEGEKSILELTEKLASNMPMSGVLGVGYKVDNQPVINESRPFISNLDDYRLDFSLLDLKKYVFPLGKYKRVIAYKASRGCPYNCSFCYNNSFNNNKWRTWSINAVIEDIEYLKDVCNIDAVKFYDDNFFVDKDRAIEILSKIDLPAHVEIRIDTITDDLAQQLKSFKIFDMLIGVESGSNRMLELIDKRFTVNMILNGVRVISKYDLPASYSAIVGLPTETKEEFESTIDLFYDIYLIHPKAGFTLGAYLPYPGSKMYDFAIKNGFKPPVKTIDWGNIDRFRKDFSSPWINARIVWRIREYFKFLNWNIGPIKKWLEFRIKTRFWFFPVDIYLLEYLASIAIEQKGLFGKGLRKAYSLMRK